MSPERLVTSCSRVGFDLYGQRMIDSVRQYWPVALTVYADATIATHADTVSTGELGIPTAWPSPPAHAGKPTNYIWDVGRFAVKAFVWADAATRLDHGFLTWLDADTITTAWVPSSFTADLMAGCDVAYLGRGAMHPETGYVGFRLPEALPLIQWCREAYVTGAYRDFTDGWTDCHVLRQGLRAVPRVRARDLTSHLIAGPWTSQVDAFALSPLGAYVTHLKGGRKRAA